MNDLIYKQDAIDTINALHEKPNAWLDSAVDAVMILPSAERKGRWIRNDNGTYSCSVCQSWIPEEQHYYARYCIYCGAKMR